MQLSKCSHGLLWPRALPRQRLQPQRWHVRCLSGKSAPAKSSVAEVLKSAPKLRVKRSDFDNYDADIQPQQQEAYKQRLHDKVLPELARKPAKSPRAKRAHKPRLKTKGPRGEAPAPGPSPVQYVNVFSGRVDGASSKFVQVQKPQAEHIPKLAHQLDRVLFSPGVQFLQDPRTRIYNYPPHLKSIVPYQDFDFGKIQQFVSASKDKTLLEEAVRNGRQFYSSTSSMTSTLHQFYLFLNNYSAEKENSHRFEFPKFTRTATTLPSSVIVEPKGHNAAGETVYSVTSDKSADVEILLSAMGHCLETFLTTGEEAFQQFLKTAPAQEPAADPAKEPQEPVNVYNYSAYGDFLMRSQLDCYDSRLPGNGTFDLKTRAVCAIRYDKTVASDSTYQIWKLKGNMESFEREYLDLIRTGGLLKYGFQARIGQMDGIFVAYHNINSFFGFQYLPLSEIDRVFYTNNAVEQKTETSAVAAQVEENDSLPSHVAESQFKASLSMWQDVMKTVIADLKGSPYEGMPFRLVTKRAVRRQKPRAKNEQAREESYLQIFAVPMSKQRVEELQGFSSKFQTSFREDISDAERMSNLEQNQAQLDRLNGDLLEESALLSYNLNASFFINGKRIFGSGYPSSTRDNCGWSYTIDRVEDPEQGKEGASREIIKGKSKAPKGKSENRRPFSSTARSKEQFVDLLKSCTQMLTVAYQERPKRRGSIDLVQNLRKYSEVGKMRLEKWSSKENPPQIYKSDSE